MKKFLFIFFNVVLFSSIGFLIFMLFVRNNRYVSLKNDCDMVSGLNSIISSALNKSNEVSSDASDIEKEYFEKKNLYDELSSKNVELNSSINDFNSDIDRYDDLISDVQRKIDSYNH